MDDSEKVCLNLALNLVPFFNIFREDMEENINQLAQDLEKCCNENADVEVIHTGSGFEGLSLPHLEKRQAWNTDADHMIIRTNLKVHEGMRRDEKDPEKSVSVEQDLSAGGDGCEGSTMATNVNMDVAENILYTFDALHSGYAYVSKKKLFHPMVSSFIREHCLQNSEFIENSQDMIPLSHTALMAVGDGSITGPSYSLPYTGGSFIVNRDFVYGLKCEFWPLQAEEWMHRDRSHCWPSPELISSISAQGCHLVPVGSHTSRLREFEWRYSFSVAEMTLAGSLTESQKLAYSVLKSLIKSEMRLRDIDVFASYHLKTCLFWFLEQNGVESWGKQSLGMNIFELLDFIISFYVNGSVPNYFISKNNMIDHRSSDEISKACHALKEVRATVTQSLCRYIETNQALPVSFDTSLSQQLKEKNEKFIQNCIYNFLVMALAYILKGITMEKNHQGEADCLVRKARLLHEANLEEGTQKYAELLAALSEVSHVAERSTSIMVLSLLEEYLATDQLKVTETSAVALAVFNVFLTLHPSPLSKAGMDSNSAEFHQYLTNTSIKESLFWAARLHEKYCDAIYDFVVKKWVNGPKFHTDDDDAKKVMKLLMVVLGKPTKQASAVTGSIARRTIEGQRFLMMRFLADYLLYVHLESAYIAFQAVAYLMGKSVLSEIYVIINWSAFNQSKLRAIELVLSKQELQSELSEEEFAKLVQMQHELLK